MSASLRQPDDNPLKDKKKWWHKRGRYWGPLHHHHYAPFMAAVLARAHRLTDCPTPRCWTFPLRNTWNTLLEEKSFEKMQNKNIQISLSCVYRWRLLFFFFLSPTDAPSLPVSGIFTASAEALLGQCVMEKYSRARGATASFLLLSGLGHVESKTMKDKAVSTGSVPQLRLSFISPRSLGQTADRSGCLWAPVQNH